jgi:hypothetical protein
MLTATTTDQILATRLRARVDTPDGPMYVKTGGWSKQTGDRLDAAMATNPDLDVRAFLGAYERVLLVDHPDVRVHAEGWCRCTPGPDADTWVRYEKHTAAGRVGHGWACPTCGGITQTG